MSRTLKRLVATAVLAACVITPAAAIAGGKAEKMRARMTGGGNVYGIANKTAETVKVTHGFTLHCRTATDPQRLQVNWSGGNSFHLTDLEDSYCADEGYDQENPQAPFDTYYGEGTGRLSTDAGREKGWAEWRFVDDGEPGGGRDEILINIMDSNGDLVLTVESKLRKGNHQAHRGTGSKA